MPYIGNNLATQFQAFATQTITGDGSTGYTLDRAVANGKELLVYINNVKQEEGSGKSYTASGTTITFSEAVASTDSCYVVFLGSAIQTVTAPAGSIVSSQFSSSDIGITGNLGVGTTSPNSASVSQAVTINASNASTGSILELNGAGTRYGYLFSNTSNTVLSSVASLPLIFNTVDTERMRIDSSGRVGIGTNSPDTQLVVANGSDTAKINLDSDSIDFFTAGKTFNLGTTDSTVIRFFANNAEAMRVDTSGNLLVGTSSDTLGGSTVEKMGVESDHTSAAQTMTVYNSSTSCGNNGILLVGTARTANSAFDIFNCWSNAVADKEFKVRGDGNVFCDGSFSGGGADYAEYFEWLDGNSDNEDRRGCSVVLDGDKIRKSTSSDDASNIIGVISVNPSVVGDGDLDRWKYKYLRDDFGGYTLDKNGDRIQNPDYDETKTYVSRDNRKEWDTVGLMGKLRIKKGQKTGTNWIKMRDISDTVEEWLVR